MKRQDPAGPTKLLAPEIRVSINSDSDIVEARQKGRQAAADVGFQFTDLALIATSISELARNIVNYAKRGEIVIRPVEDSGQHGIMVVARDEGPGIRNIEQAMQVGYSTSGGLGLGLPGVRRLMDQFEIISRPGQGTSITITKWKP